MWKTKIIEPKIILEFPFYHLNLSNKERNPIRKKLQWRGKFHSKKTHLSELLLPLSRQDSSESWKIKNADESMMKIGYTLSTS